MCIYIYIINIHSAHYVNKNFYFGCDCLTALIHTFIFYLFYCMLWFNTWLNTIYFHIFIFHISHFYFMHVQCVHTQTHLLFFIYVCIKLYHLFHELSSMQFTNGGTREKKAWWKEVNIIVLIKVIKKLKI